MRPLKYMTLTDIAEKVLKVTHPSLVLFAKRNREIFPKPNAMGKYNIVDVLKVVSEAKNNSKLKMRAQMALSEAGVKDAVESAEVNSVAEDVQPEQMKPPVTLPKLPDVGEKTGVAAVANCEKSFEDILNQYRTAVANTAEAYEQCIGMGDFSGASAWLRLWGQAFDALGRAEERALEIGQKSGKLMPVDEVVAIIARAYGNVRGKLMALPQKLCFELAGTSTPGQAQKILDEEIREVLNELAENPIPNSK